MLFCNRFTLTEDLRVKDLRDFFIYVFALKDSEFEFFKNIFLVQSEKSCPEFLYGKNTTISQ